MASPTTLVTGATGFVGSHLVDHLLDSGYRVRCLVRKTSLLRFLPAGRVELAYGSLSPAEGLYEALDGVEIVFHLAGVTKAIQPQDYYSVNVTGTENLLAACAGAGISRFVHVSSLAAVGPSGSGNPLPEDGQVPMPIGHYGSSKLESEVRVRHSDVGKRAVIIRPPVVYGPRDTDVLEIFKGAAKGVLIKIGRGESFFSLIYVKDLAAGLLAAAASSRAPGKTYFLANRGPVSWTEFAGIAAEHMHRKLRVFSIPFRAAWAVGCLGEIRSRLQRKAGIISREKVAEGRCRYWVCDPSLAAADLSFEARTSVADGVAETLVWYKEAGWLKY